MKWYRIEDHLVSAGVDEFDNPLGPAQLQISVREFEVEKETPKGVWLRSTFFRRFVLRDARKKYACPSKEAALESFLARKKKQRNIYAARVARAENAMSLAKALIDDSDLMSLVRHKEVRFGP